MIKKKDKLEVPWENRIYIDPQTRLDLFPNLIENFKIFLPNIKVFYAYLNRDANIPIDFIIMGEDKENDVIAWDIPHIYTNRCMPAYLYTIKNNLYQDYFDTVKDHLVKIRISKFNEFIKLACNLSLDPKDLLYWKNPNNSKILIDNLLELSNLYT